MTPFAVLAVAGIATVALLPLVARLAPTPQWRVLIAMASMPAVAVWAALGMGAEALHLAQAHLGWSLAFVMAGIIYVTAYVPLLLSPGPAAGARRPRTQEVTVR